MCKAFSTTLKGTTRVWFNKLTPNTMSNFKELSRHFVTHFIGGQRYKISSASLLNIEQWEDESLRSYATHFNKEAFLIDETDMLYKNDLKNMANMLYKAKKYMNSKDAMIAWGGRPKKRERQDDPHLDKGRKSTRTSD